MINRRGQSILEYTLMVIIMLGVVLTMKDYVKRDLQGRWKSSADDLSDQYDPQYVNSMINYATQVNAISTVSVTNGTYSGQQGQWTMRGDLTNTVETKTGYTQVGS